MGAAEIDGVCGSCLMCLVMSCSTFGAGNNWKVEMNSLGGLSDSESEVGDVEEVEDE